MQDQRWIRLGRLFAALNVLGALICASISVQMNLLPHLGLKWLPSHLPSYLWRLIGRIITPVGLDWTKIEAWFSSIAWLSLRLSPNEFSMEGSWVVVLSLLHQLIIWNYHQCAFIMSLGVLIAFLLESISVPYMVEWDHFEPYNLHRLWFNYISRDVYAFCAFRVHSLARTRHPARGKALDFKMNPFYFNSEKHQWKYKVINKYETGQYIRCIVGILQEGGIGWVSSRNIYVFTLHWFLNCSLLIET